MAPDDWWIPAYIGIGSNLDRPQHQVRAACAALGRLPRTRPVRASPLYRSPPLDGSDQPDYINAVAAILTQLAADELLASLQALETALGRVRAGLRWTARVIDLDLLMYGHEVIETTKLRVPHPGVHERAFVLRPLAALAPALQVPGHGRVADLLAAVDCSGVSEVLRPDDAAR